MAVVEVKQWKADDGRMFPSPNEAIAHNAKYWEERALKAEKIIKEMEASQKNKKNDSGPVSSYGSSGGGGHD